MIRMDGRFHDRLITREMSMLVTLHNQPQSYALSKATRFCTHSRIIDDVLTPQGLKTGKVRCIECGAVFDDPATNKENGRTVGGRPLSFRRNGP